MPHIVPLNLAEADSDTARTLTAVKSKLGMVPNLFTTLARAPVAFNGYLQLSEILSGGRLTAGQREIVALAVGQENGCQYCVSAHTVLGKGAGLSAEEMQKARAGTASAPLDAAIAAFARRVVAHRGRLSPGDLQAARRAGLDDGLVLEVIANVALNVLTNYTNHVAGTDVDFPPVSV